ncbi:MAG: DUF433 domain-containing protein [Bacillota bacterium]|nr:DUF433 domain-containing protein [Bacillota bacterium]
MTRVSGCCGGRPVIRGTRFTVSSVVFYALRQGTTPEELVREFPPPHAGPGLRRPLVLLRPQRRNRPGNARQYGACIP